MRRWMLRVLGVVFAMLTMATRPPALAGAADDGNAATVAPMDDAIDAAAIMRITGITDDANYAEGTPADIGMNVLILPSESALTFPSWRSTGTNFVDGGQVTKIGTEDAHAEHFAAWHLTLPSATTPHRGRLIPDGTSTSGLGTS